MRKLAKFGVVFTLILAFSGIIQAGVIMIDDFNSVDAGGATYWSHDFVRTDPPDTTQTFTMYETGLSTVLGGIRTTTLTCAPHTYTTLTPPYTTNGGFDGGVYDDDITYQGYVGLFISNGNALNGEGTINLAYEVGGLYLEGGSVTVAVLPDHFGYEIPNVLSLTLFDGVDTETVSRLYETYETFDSFFDVTYDASEFSVVDLANIQTLEFTYVADISNDVIFGEITANVVPEPATICLLGAGVLLGLLKKRRG